MDMVSYYSRFIDVDGELHHAGDFLITRNKIIMELGLIMAVCILSLAGIYGLLVRNLEGTKGIERKPFYGKYSGKIHTAKKRRENHIV